MDIEGLHQLIGYLREDFKSFKNNDFKHLEERVEKLGTKIAWIMGIIGGIFTIANILVRIYV